MGSSPFVKIRWSHKNFNLTFGSSEFSERFLPLKSDGGVKFNKTRSKSVVVHIKSFMGSLRLRPSGHPELSGVFL